MLNPKQHTACKCGVRSGPSLVSLLPTARRTPRANRKCRAAVSNAPPLFTRRPALSPMSSSCFTKTARPHQNSTARGEPMPVTVVQAQATEAPQVSPEPPAEAPAQVDAVRTYKLAPTVRNIKGSCQGKLRFEVEYMQKRGTSDNSYLITVPGANALVDVPYEAYMDKFMESLASNIRVTELTHIIITHLDPKAIPTLKAVLNKLTAAGKRPTVVLSNPGLRLLQSVFGEKEEDVHLLSAAQYSVGRSGMGLTLGHNCQVQLQLTPTPRWPDLMMAYLPSERILFSSKFFSAHVASSEDHHEGLGQLHTNHGSWEAFKDDWRYFFECMLAPSPRQAATALDKLPIVPANRPSAPASLQESLAKPVNRPRAPAACREAWPSGCPNLTY
ncbi:beta-lactamase-like protein, partial [Dunaliella salina]